MKLNFKQFLVIFVISEIFLLWLFLFSISRDYSLPENNKTLAGILRYEINKSNLPPTAVCKDYMFYYNKTLTEKYPELDVRPIRYVDICNNQCDYSHTFIVVAGYGSECILDRLSFVCLDMPEIRNKIDFKQRF